MEPNEFLQRLDGHIADLRAILSRFVRTRDAIRIQLDDQSKLQQLVLELRDLLHDALGNNDYSKMVVNAFNEGVSNFFHSSSKASVEQLISIASAAKTRIESNPTLLKTIALQAAAQAVPLSAPPVLAIPETVTLKWLFNHVPYSIWLGAVGAAVAIFVAGVTAAAKLSIVQQWFGLVCK